METKITGKVIVLGNNIDTDQIYPGRFLEITNPQEIGKRCLSGVNPEIAEKFQKGDIVVAGSNFGCGSSREHAAIAIINMGASVVLADSFARIFFRNSINLGLPLITCKGISSKVKDGQLIELDIEAGELTIKETGEVLKTDKLGDYAMSILEAGGIKPLMREKMRKLKEDK
ncbi:MAG: 3-isopropylmalate dehydratase small subunit [Dethiosulfatibacter sp.]|nr:3-isopropylmalate dehydratase small subunit [Dethiosulfatibacter sp.]